MGEWALGAGFRSETFGTTSGTTTHGGTSVTGSATANTKGSYTQIASSTSFDATAIMVNIDAQFTDTNYLMDIAVGGAGSEVIVIPDLMFAQQAGKSIAPIIPICIPAGSRIAARVADNFGSSPAYISITLFSGAFTNFPPIYDITAYGVVTTGSTGTTVDAGTPANSKGSWTQIVASTTQAHKGLMIAAARPSMSVAVAGAYMQLTDLGIGAASSEQILVPNLRFNGQNDAGATNARPNVEPAFILLPPCDIPSGSRLAMRQQSTTTDAQDRTCAFVLYGLS